MKMINDIPWTAPLVALRLNPGRILHDQGGRQASALEGAAEACAVQPQGGLHEEVVPSHSFSSRKVFYSHKIKSLQLILLQFQSDVGH